MVTRDQAIAAGAAWGRTEFHANGCTRTIGARGGVKERTETWRSNGKCQTWKTRPEDFSLPIKYGFRGPYTYITPTNAHAMHLAAECPLLATEQAVS